MAQRVLPKRSMQSATRSNVAAAEPPVAYADIMLLSDSDMYKGDDSGSDAYDDDGSSSDDEGTPADATTASSASASQPVKKKEFRKYNKPIDDNSMNPTDWSLDKRLCVLKSLSPNDPKLYVR